MAFSPDSKLLATANAKGIHFWDVTGALPVWCASRKTDDSVFSLAFRADGRVLASGHSAGTVRETAHEAGAVSLWDVSEITKADRYSRGGCERYQWLNKCVENRLRRRAGWLGFAVRGVRVGRFLTAATPMQALPAPRGRGVGYS
jgi:Anaphase-promoting complex subunit 4 WD40 domain